MEAATVVSDRALDAEFLAGCDGVGGGRVTAGVGVAGDVDQLQGEAGQSVGTDVQAVLVNQGRGLPLLQMALSLYPSEKPKHNS